MFNNDWVSALIKRALNLFAIDTRSDTSTRIAFENIVGKGEIARNEQFLLFPQRFLPNQIIVSRLVHIYDIISLFGHEFEKPKIGISGKELTLYRTIPTSNDPKEKSLLKTL